MKVSDKQVAGMLLAGFEKYCKHNRVKVRAETKALFFAGAAIGIASQDGSASVVEAVTQIALDAVESEARA